MDMSCGSVVGLFLIQLSFGKIGKSALYRTEICLLVCSQNKRFCFILDWIKYLDWLECFIWFSEYPLAFKIQVNPVTKHLWVGWFFFFYLFFKEWFSVENGYTETCHFHSMWNNLPFWNFVNFFKFSFLLKIWLFQYGNDACSQKAVS